MARKKRRPVRPPKAPRPSGPGPSAAREAPQAGEVETAPGQSSEELAQRYGYVRRDLARIAVLGVIMLVFIFATTFLALG